jgi:phosphoribosyl-ATP pyrophosphohydrolase
MIGTKAEPEFLAELPRERLIAALDEKGGQVVVEGWTKGTGRLIEERMALLAPYVSGFLATFVDAEGSLSGISEERARSLLASAKGVRVTFAGGAASAAEIGALDRMGADVQAGTAVALGRLALADAFAACLLSDRPDGLWPTVVCDQGGKALGLVWSDLESLRAALESGRGVYKSRSRGLWVKGESSGDVQDLIRVETDCDRDALRFTVRQNGRGFCHLGRRSCFDDGSGVERLERTLLSRRAQAPAGSYTRKLFDDPALLGSKLREEADELNKAKNAEEATCEAADVIYFALTKAIAMGSSLASIEEELDRRALKVSRRGGAAKSAYIQSSEDMVWTGEH